MLCNETIEEDQLRKYRRKLLVFLSVASFFEGYDFIALTQLLPELRENFSLSRTEGGLLIGFINIGTIAAYGIVRQADRVGRKQVLAFTIAGYAILTGLSGLAPNAIVFGTLQLMSRAFMIAEWVTSLVIAAEEFPANRRGTVVGTIQACASLGSIVCAGIIPTLKSLAPAAGPGFLWLPEGTDYRFRVVYFIGVIPLFALAYARRNLKETRRFRAIKSDEPAPQRSLLHIFRTRHRKRVLQLGLIWTTSYLCMQNGVAFFKDYAMTEAGLTDTQVADAVKIAALVSMPFVFYVSRLLDALGRRPSAAIIFGTGAFGILIAYQSTHLPTLTLALVLGVFASSASNHVLNTYTTELFPTELRADAFAWSNNVLGRIGYVGSPILVGYLADQFDSWGLVLTTTAVFPLITIWLIYWLLPETKHMPLEETEKLGV
ncbi:MAG: MFS transporter [Myxococcota bacterium]